MPMRATVVLAAVAGEEQGLLGSKGLSELAESQGWNVEGMITNDIVGGIEGGDGSIDNRTIRIFAGTQKPIGETSARHWGRFVRDVTRDNLPQVKPRLIYRLDRFGRGGDHIPFFQKGIPAIRFTEAHENYRRQHQNVRTENGVEYGDLAKYVSPDYMRLVASVNLAAVYSAAAAPAAPRDVKVSGAVTDDTTLTWNVGGDDVAGYEMVVRDTTDDEWRRVIDLGKVATYTLKGVPIDNYFFGVRSMDSAGHRSPVRTPEEK
ncbi:MAG TPA: M28 family metallopeptidase, partial [Thermoanaerobaculia bacterium]|nr:M28 family metallopeptidase [Thermoanaerobaculia bacterium]